MPLNPSLSRPAAVLNCRRRCVFSSRNLTGDLPSGGWCSFRRTFSAFFSILFPDDCRVCGLPLPGLSRIPVCPACLRQPEPFAPEFFCSECRTPFRNAFPLDNEGRCALCRTGLRGFDAAYSFGAYEGTLRKLIHLLKYGRVKPLAAPLGERLASAIPLDQRFDCIIPVPLHWRRQWRRGFNQSALLAKAVARRYGLPVVSGLRRRATSAQAGLSNPGRRANVSGAFAVRRRSDVTGRRVLLIDDVMTTGATASACASVLKRAGAAYVAVLTLARVDRRLAAEPFAAVPAKGGFRAAGAGVV